MFVFPARIMVDVFVLVYLFVCFDSRHTKTAVSIPVKCLTYVQKIVGMCDTSVYCVFSLLVVCVLHW